MLCFLETTVLRFDLLLYYRPTDVSLSLFYSQVTSMQYKNYGILKNTVISHSVKGTLMPIWKSLHMFVFLGKWYPENFAFWILRIIELLTRIICYYARNYFLDEDKCIVRFFKSALVYLKVLYWPRCLL